MNKHNIYFSQSMLTKIANISASTISRLTSKLEMKTVRSEVRKKYDFEEARIILNEIIGKEYDINKKIQVFFNFKGGTGKTTICHQVSIHMALLGFKVLVIDCDPQAHLTYALGILEEEDKLTLAASLQEFTNRKLLSIFKPLKEFTDFVFFSTFS